MTLQYQPRFGGAVTGRRYDEFSKDGGRRMRNAAIGGAVGGTAAYEGLGLGLAGVLHHETNQASQGRSFMDTAKPVMRHWNNPSSMAHLARSGRLDKGRLGAFVGGSAAIGAGLGALRGGKKPPQIAPTYNTTLTKADDWRNITEHQTQAAQGRRRTRHGGFVASIGAGAMGAAGTQGLREMGTIAQMHGEAHNLINSHNREVQEWGGQRIGLGNRAKMHGVAHLYSMKKLPLGHVSGAGAGLLATGAGMALSGAHKRRKHDRAITQLRRQRATTPVGKSRGFDPENSRQRHLGAAEAVTGLAGAGALGTGLHGIHNTTRIARRTPTAYTLPKEETAMEQKMRVKRQKAAGQKPTVPRGDHIRFGEMKATRHLVGGKRRDVLLAAGGLAGLGAAGAIHNHAHSARGRTWY